MSEVAKNTLNLVEDYWWSKKASWEKSEFTRLTANGKPPKNNAWKKKFKVPKKPDADGMPEIPSDWVWESLERVCEKITDGTHHSPSNTATGDYKYITAKNIKPWGIDLKKITYVDTNTHNEIYARCDVKKGDVLYIKDGATTGLAAVNTLEEEFSLLSSVGVFRPTPILNSVYLKYALNSPYVRDAMLANVAGVAITRLTLTKLKAALIPVAPLEQQKRIVAKIEELFSHIDAGIEALNKAKHLLKQYRQSVLKAAVTGELTKEWREARIKDEAHGSANVAGGRTPGATKLEPASQLLERILQERRQKWEEQQLAQFKAKGKMPKDDKWKEKYKEPSAPEIDSLPELPEEWLWVTMGALCEKITDGTHHSPENNPEGEYKYITAKNIKPWRIDLTKITYVDKKVHDEIYARCDVKKGDVLYIKDGATTGIAALNNIDGEFSLLSSVGVLRFPPECHGDYFVSSLNSPLIKDMLLSKVAGVAITRLTLRKLNEGLVTLPPIDEQYEIVRIVNKKLYSIERLEIEIDCQLKKADQNKQSILALAFSGGLISA